MTKFLSIFFAFLLFIGTIGPSFNLHFCGGKFVSYSFINKAQRCCGASCKSCKDFSIAYKIKGNFLKHALVIDKPETLKPDLIFTEIIRTFHYQNINIPIELTNPPPGFNLLINISTRILRI